MKLSLSPRQVAGTAVAIVAAAVIGILASPVSRTAQPAQKRETRTARPSATIAQTTVAAPRAVPTTVARTTPAAPSNDEDGLDPRVQTALATIRAAANDPSAVGSRTLTKALDDDDIAVQQEAIDLLVARKHQPTLNRLIKMDPAADPYLGPSIIAGIGELGRASTDASMKKAALDRLLALLASEKERNGRDSLGNVITIIEAIGNLGHPDGAPALERELADGYHEIANKTTIVLALGKLGQPSSVPALTQLRGTVSILQNEESFSRELKQELVAAIDDVSKNLRNN